MQIAVLETFLKIAEVGSFSRASQLLFVSQPTVTARIQRLESNLGQKLFRRTNSAIELTHAGNAFLPYSQTVVQNWRKARQEIALPQGFTGILTVAFNAVIGDTKMLIDKLDAGEIDIAVLHEPEIKTDWSTRKLFGEELILVSTSHRELVRWDPKYVYIDWGSGYREQHFRAYPVDDTPLVAFSDARIALDYLLKVGGSAYLPRRWLAMQAYENLLYPILGAPIFERDVFMVYDTKLSSEGWRQDVIETLFSE
ncbi:MAG: LysR family transcriptional regulator [Paralcaligenes sp.]